MQMYFLLSQNSTHTLFTSWSYAQNARFKPSNQGPKPDTPWARWNGMHNLGPPKVEEQDREKMQQKLAIS